MFPIRTRSSTSISRSEVFIIAVDKDREKIALGLKQKSASPWEGVEAKYPVASRHTGEVVNVMSYGAFVKLEPGIEGLVHISEMSWTKRINHPSELVSIGDHIEVQVLNINKDKQEISLGMKQVQPNPWDKVAERYPQGTVITGTVRNLTNYGAFIEIEEGIDGLLHVSDMSWVRKVSHPSEVVNKGDKVTCIVLNVDQERKRIALGLKQMASDPWEGDIPSRYHPGDLKKGKVTKLTNFGVFVELEPGLEGLLHISELADHKVESPEEIVKVGDEIEVKVLRVEPKDRKIGLSRKNLYGGPEPEVTETDEAKPQRELRGGTGSGGGDLFSMPEAAARRLGNAAGQSPRKPDAGLPTLTILRTGALRIGASRPFFFCHWPVRGARFFGFLVSVQATACTSVPDEQAVPAGDAVNRAKEPPFLPAHPHLAPIAILGR